MWVTCGWTKSYQKGWIRGHLSSGSRQPELGSALIARATGPVEASTKFLLAWGRGTLTIQDKDGTLAIIKVSVE
jgi:hypothetical protein